MGKKRTNWTDLPEGAVVVAIDITSADCEQAECVLGEMLAGVGEENFSLAMDHLYKLFVYDVLTNEDSPIHSVFRQAMARLSERTMEHLHHSHTKIESLEEEIKGLRSELKNLRGRLQTLEAALGSVRRCLKSDDAKRCVQYCQKFRRKPPVGEAETVASELAETVKNACICIKEV